MKQFSTFIFESADLEPTSGKIQLRYSLDDEIHFKETIKLPSGATTDVDIDAALQALHMIGGISYYKTCLPKEIEVRSQDLNEDQANVWNTVYEHGLGEFFFRNDIDFRNLINFPKTIQPSNHQTTQENNQSTSTSSSQSLRADGKSQKCLVPIGGGKDSIVTIERLRKQEKDITLLRMGSHPLIDEMVEITGLPCITVTRSLDPQLFTLNEQGALNGHVPITAYLSCLAVVIAKLYGFDEIVMSNEKSANEGNTEYLGKQINHQWSKSEEFQQMFSHYIQKYIDPNLHYRSELRQMTELEIAKEFVNYPEYFNTVTSCNKNWKVGGGALGVGGGDRWCRTCPKCAFVFAILAAHLPKKQIVEMFGGNMLEDEELIPLYKKLLGLEGFKPFECVGTPQETKEALELVKKKGEFDNSVVITNLKFKI